MPNEYEPTISDCEAAIRVLDYAKRASHEAMKDAMTQDEQACARDNFEMFGGCEMAVTSFRDMLLNPTTEDSVQSTTP